MWLGHPTHGGSGKGSMGEYEYGHDGYDGHAWGKGEEVGGIAVALLVLPARL